ncbi:MAG: VTT domain-containing protein [bacterium]|nr:VTT domain-containing protein [bacterium]
MPEFLDPAFLIDALGLAGVLAIVFAESGLFFGFFLPGDSLLFTAGLIAAQGYLSVIPLALGAFAAAVAGDSVGYAFGKRVGPKLFSREDSFFFHKRHIERTQRFYERYGAKTILIARVVPIVRTFAPILAGVGAMPYRTFLRYNIVGGFVWAVGFVALGYFFGSAFPQLERYTHWVVLAIIVISMAPIVVGAFREWRSHTRDPHSL